MTEAQDHIKQHLRELVETDQKIAGLEEHLTNLREHRANIKRWLERHNPNISSIHQLPDDILGEIFYNCLPSHRPPVPVATEAPLLLTQVCGKWRSVALNWPRLWARLHIAFCYDYIPPPAHRTTAPLPLQADFNRRMDRALEAMSRRAQMVKEWLRRSHACPLTISLYCGNPLQPLALESLNSDDPVQKILMDLANQAYRLESFQLSLPVEVYAHIDRLFSPYDIPMLTELKTNLHLMAHGQLSGTDDGVEARLLTAPHLRRLSIDGYNLPSRYMFRSAFPPNPISTFQWKSLQYFSSSVPLSRYKCSFILKECTNLHSCRLHVHWFNPQASNPEVALIKGTARLPSLRLFSVFEDDTDSEYERALEFYSSIDAPNLQWIDYQSGAPNQYQYQPDQAELPNDHDSTGLGHTLLPLLRQCAGLKKLTLDPYSFSRRGIQEVLRCVSPTLTHLVFGQEKHLRVPKVQRGFNVLTGDKSDMVYDFGFLELNSEKYTYTSGAWQTEILLPNLEKLELSTGSISDEMLLKTITSRLQAFVLGGCARLKLVRVIFKRIQKLDVIEEVETFCQKLDVGPGRSLSGQGVVLDLEYPSQAEIPVGMFSPSSGVQDDRLWWTLELEEYGEI